MAALNANITGLPVIVYSYSGNLNVTKDKMYLGLLQRQKQRSQRLRDLSTLQAGDIARFRDREAKELSRSTANLSVKVLRVCLGEAVRQRLLNGQSGHARQAASNQLRNRSGARSRWWKSSASSGRA